MLRQPLESVVAEWLERFAQCVREVDYETARRLFVDDVLAFGTRTRMMHDLTHLESQQWRQIWPNTHGFQFDLASMRCHEEGRAVYVFVLWCSFGVTEAGTSLPRAGRATLILTRDERSALRAIHTHFSLDPEP